MAEKKESGRSGKPAGIPKALLFWAIFAVFVIGLFVVNREQIQTTLRNTGIVERLAGGSGGAASEDGLDGETAGEDGGLGESEEDFAAALDRVDALLEEAGEDFADREDSSDSGTLLALESPPAATPPESAGAAPEAPPAVAAENFPQPLYFMRPDRDGVIVRTRVIRSMRISDAPLIDVLQALLRGPNTEEHNQGLISLIPAGTRVLSTQVQGGTAYINFSEDFLFNRYGVEGYAAQLRQIVWTVTELPGIRDVQALIEGRRIDYLGEGIWIGGPVNRDNYY